MRISDKIASKVSLLVLMTAGFGGQILGEEGVSEKSSATHFTFTKEESLISRPSNMRAPGPYYTCLVKMKGVKKFPYDYVLYFSTDHGETGGIWMYVCNGSPTFADNWKSYDWALANGKFDYLEKKPTANPIFVDKTQGKQTETPHANIIDGMVYMTYHNAGAGRGQSTLLATSQDGVNFSRINGDKNSVILDYRGGPGNGHTGYFRWGHNPFAGVKHKYVGYSLHGGGNNYHSAMWASDNAIDWNKLEVFTPREGHAIDKNNLLIWHEFDPNSITSLGNGEYIAICAGGNRASGSAGRVVELYEVFLADDGRTLTRESRKILGQGPSGTADENEVAEPTSIVIGDTWHLIYVGTKNNGKVNTVMGATGKLNKAVLKSKELTPSDRQRHFHSN
jgi:hypothetical protein